MKTKMMQKMGLLAVTFLSLALVTACSPAAGSKKMEAPASDIVSKPGFYQDNKIGFSFSWPKQIMSVADKLQQGEVLRYKAKQGLPVITLSIREKAKDIVPLEEVPKNFKEYFETMLKKSKPLAAQNFNLVEGKLTTVSNGFPAAYARVTWEAAKGEYAMVTVSITIYKSDKVVIVTCTAPQEVPPLEVLNNWVTAFKVDA